MKETSYFSRLFAVACMLAAISCGKEIETETLQPDRTPAEQPAEVRTYKMSIKAGKGKEATRALSLEGGTLSATWAEGEVVTVYNGETSLGTLTALSDGASTTLEGELTGGTIAANDVLTLKFLSPSYGSQVGTLEYIAANCDYATATVTVKSVADDNKITIKESAANFENQQAIVKFTLRQTDGTTAVSALPLKVVVGDNTYTVTPTAATDELFVAVPAIDGEKLILAATAGSTDYSYVKYNATFQSGKYYTITVKMSDRTVVYNETELNDAISAGKTNILMGCNIPLENYCGIGSDKTVTLDLGGNTLSRSLETANDYGSVIRVSTGGTLTIIDSSENGATTRADASTTSTGTGKITGGRATFGGGICNHGTLTLAGGTIVSNLASSAGGGIYNAPSNSGGTPAHFTMTGGVVLGNWGEDCGGVYNYTGSYINIEGGTIKGNTSNAGGGGVVNYGNATITGGTIVTNHATTRGGGIWNGGILTMGEVSISDNQADVAGGGIYLNAASRSTLTGTTISGNTSSDAGGLFVATDESSVAEITLDNCVISGNESTEHGGGGIVNYGTVTLSGSSITGNTCHTDGGGIWDNGTLNVQGALAVNGNSGDDIFLKSGKVISLAGALSGGENSIGINMEKPGTFTYLYSSSGTGDMPFFSNHAVNRVGQSGDECKMLYGYYECSWNDTSEKVVRTAKVVPENMAVDNLCDSKYSNGGELWGNSLWFVVDGTVTISETLTAQNEVNLILCDGAQLTLTQGLVVNSGATLRIFCQSYGDDMGKLISLNTKADCAGIGGSKGNDTGTIIIHGGRMSAKGGEGGGAGIGGADYKNSGDITIYDGAIHGESCDTYDDNSCGAGIGGGQDGSVKSITIYGGSITALGHGAAAGLGSGARKSQLGPITIYGGSITATGGDQHQDRGGGAGIGTGGEDTDAEHVWGGTITISGGTILARGGKGGSSAGAYGGGAGIGTGGKASGWIEGSVIKISGGNIDAQGGQYEDDDDDDGAGIGGGHCCPGGNVVITGGVVKAKAGAGHATAIGGGDEATDHGTLTIDFMKVSLGSTPVNYSLRWQYCRSSGGSVSVERCDHGSVSDNACQWCGLSIPSI